MCDFSDVLHTVDAQQCADLVYLKIQVLIDHYYPLKTIVLSDRDPTYMTPELKLLLRQKNRLMRAGKTEHAAALAVKIGKFIAAFNSKRLTDIHPLSTSKDLWVKSVG